MPMREGTGGVRPLMEEGWSKRVVRGPGMLIPGSPAPDDSVPPSTPGLGVSPTTASCLPADRTSESGAKDATSLWSPPAPVQAQAPLRTRSTGPQCTVGSQQSCSIGPAAQAPHTPPSQACPTAGSSMSSPTSSQRTGRHFVSQTTGNLYTPGPTPRTWATTPAWPPATWTSPPRASSASLLSSTWPQKVRVGCAGPGQGAEGACAQGTPGFPSEAVKSSLRAQGLCLTPGPSCAQSQGLAPATNGKEIKKRRLWSCVEVTGTGALTWSVCV